MKRKYSVEIGNVGQFVDRYMQCGYNEECTVEQQFARLASIKAVTGVELVSTWHITDKNVNELEKLIKEYGFQLVSIIVDHFAQRKWGRGAFSSKDPAIRKQAVEDTKTMMDIVRYLGGDIITLWPGQDGYDYAFQGDYIQEREWIREGIKECCKYRKDVKLSLEYKLREPRIRYSYIATAANTVLLVNAINEDNCGITLDFGHSLQAGENPAESAAIIKQYSDKLFHVHMNDNYGGWDDDCIAGVIHPVDFIEFLYWVKRVGYNGWFSFDQYTYRENGRDALEEGINWIEGLSELADEIDRDTISKLFSTGNAVEVSRMLRTLLIK